MDEIQQPARTRFTAGRVGLVVAGLVAGAAIGLTGVASAATGTPTPSPGTGSTAPSTTSPDGTSSPDV